MLPKKGLGKGIGAIFEENGVEFPTDKGMVKELRISSIEPNKEQPRKAFDKDALEELAQSIRDNGVLQPIIVREIADGRYQIVAGERRWRASRIAGLTVMPAVVTDYDENKAMEVALIENLQREDLNPMEESEGYFSLKEKFGLSQEEIAKRVGKSRPAVANSLRLLSLPAEIKEMVSGGKLSEGHARALLSCSDGERMLHLAQKAAQEELSVRQVEQLSKAEIKKPKAPSGLMMEKYITAELEKQLSEQLSRKVKINDGGKKGTIEIEFYGTEDLEELLNLLGANIDL